MQSVCGIDFGTSNSSVAIPDHGRTRLLPLQGTATAIPTAVFYSTDDNTTTFGREAIQRYLEREPGRLMRSIKTLLGTALYDDITQIGGRRYPFSAVVASFLTFLRAKAGEELGLLPDEAVIGRPAFFVDNNAAADAKAESQLEAAARAAGFRSVSFQFEPIAAALAYEQTVAGEEMALVADIGGGTSDFSLVRVSPDRANRPDRRDDILGYNGVRVGGTDFDRWLSLATLMPFLGRHSRLRTKGLEPPAWYYADLATWHRINMLYEGRVHTEIRGILRDATEPEKIERLLRVIELRKGHDLLGRIEHAKIELSASETAGVALSDLIDGLQLVVSRDRFEAAIADGLSRIEDRVRALVAEAGVGGDAIATVFLTGGSSGVPSVRDAITRTLPNAKVIVGDAFGSVARGLAIAAGHRAPDRTGALAAGPSRRR